MIVMKSIKKIYEVFTKIKYKIFFKYFPIAGSKSYYKKATGKKLNLENPRDFNEKLQWLKIYWRHPLVTQCADKYEMHKYAKDCGCQEVLNEIYGIYNNTSEIEWDKFPNKFAIKTTNGCGTNIICDSKINLNIKKASKQINKWLKTDYSLAAGEFHYAKMRPRIICEKYIETGNGLLPNDYKIYCFNGKAKLILVATDRASNLKLNFLDLNWNRLDIGSDKYNQGALPEKPSCLNEMIKYAEILSSKFPFVRIDFYNFDGKPLLGEMTFTPAACAATYYNDNGLTQLGNLINLPEKYNASIINNDSASK